MARVDWREEARRARQAHAAARRDAQMLRAKLVRMRIKLRALVFRIDQELGVVDRSTTESERDVV